MTASTRASDISISPDTSATKDSTSDPMEPAPTLGCGEPETMPNEPELRRVLTMAKAGGEEGGQITCHILTRTVHRSKGFAFHQRPIDIQHICHLRGHAFDELPYPLFVSSEILRAFQFT